MKIDEPEIAAARMHPCKLHAAGTCPSAFYKCRVDAIRADRANIASALAAALDGPAPIIAARFLLSMLSEREPT